MKNLLKAEELAQFGLGIYLFSLTGYSGWIFPLVLLLPDLSMIGYLKNAKTGAVLYNIFHHKGIAILIYLGGVYSNISEMELVGIVLYSHSCMDRFFGYGLKYFKGFSYTNLGRIGKIKNH